MSKTIHTLQPEGITPLTATLIEPTLPDSISWAPDAPGWTCVMGFLGIYVLYKLYAMLRHYQSNAYRRAALKQLSEITNSHGEIAKLPVLLKRTALYAYPREQVASLIGKHWESWLDAHCKGSDFSTRHQGILSTLAYSPKTLVEPTQLSALCGSIEFWIKNHEVNDD